MTAESAAATKPELRDVLRRLAVLAVLTGLMYGLQFVALSEGAGATDPRTLAAIGFALLAAFTVGELGGLLGLPRVTGYILAGVLLGPHVSDLMSARVAQDLQVFNTLALGLIATTAGLELDVGALKRLWRTLGATVGLKLLLLPPIVGGAFLLVAPHVTIEGAPAGGSLHALALLLAILGIGTSPAIAVAVINDTRATGRMAELVLGMAVVKDVVVVLALALGIAVSRTLIGGGGMDAGALSHLGRELGGSVLAGAVVGGLAIAYVRFVHREMLVFVGASVLVVAQFSAALHLELLLVFIVAGFVVRNLSPYEHEVLAPLEMVALPVFVVFFSTAGANLDLPATWAVLPLAAALFGARAVTFVVASRLGGRAGAEPDHVRRHAWLGYLPQAGVTLGLVLLAAQALPEIAAPLKQVGLALVALNLLVGPVTLGVALRKEDAEASRAPSAAPVEVESPPDAPPLPPDAAALLDSLEGALRGRVETLLETRLGPWVEGRRGALEEVLGGDIGSSERRRAARRYATAEREESDAERVEVLQALLRDLRAALLRLPISTTVDVSGRPREVPLRVAARVTLEPRLAAAVRDTLRIWYQAEAGVVEALQRRVFDGLDGDPLAPVDAAGDHVAERLDGAISAGMAALRVAVGTGGARKLRFSQVQTVEDTLSRLAVEGRGWARGLEATCSQLVLADALTRARARVESVLTRRFQGPLGRVQRQTAALLEGVRERLAAMAETLETETPELPEPPATLASQAWPRTSRQRLRQLIGRAQVTTALAPLAAELRRIVAEAPERLLVPGDGPSVVEADRPEAVQTVTVPVRHLLETHLEDGFIPEPMSAGHEMRKLVMGIDARVGEAINVASFAVEHLAKEPSEEARVGARQAVARAVEQLDLIEGELAERLDHTGERLSLTLGNACGRVSQEAQAVSASLARRARGAGAARRLVAWLAGRARAARAWLRRSRAHLGARSNRVVRDLRIKAGVDSLDATELRAHLDAAAPEDPALELPGVVKRAFALTPVEDRRLFAVNREALAEGVAAERASAAGARSGFLVRGGRGSGRSSVLNMLLLELSAERILKPEVQISPRTGGLVAALAAELECDPTVRAVHRALAEERTAIVVDDLEHWLVPSGPGFRAFAEVQRLVAESPRSTFWAASLSNEADRMLTPLLQLDRLFAREVQLPAASAADALALAEARLRLAGHTLSFGREGRRRGLLGRDLRAAWGREVRRAGGGSLLGVMLALRGARWGADENVIRAGIPSAVDVPLGAQLRPRQTALLATLYRFGPMEVATLEAVFGGDPLPLDSALAHLQLSGLVDFAPGTEALRLARRGLPAVSSALRQAGLVGDRG